MTRTGTFEYVAVPTTTSVSQAVDYYKSADYQEFMVKPVDTLIIVQDGKEFETPLGSQVRNKYIIKSNFFMTNLADGVIQDVANRLFPLVRNFTYQPFNADVNGLPYAQCLDVVSIPVYPIDGSSDVPTPTPFLVLERTLSGIQALRDNFIAEGDEYQHEFVTDVSIDIQALKQEMEYLKQNLDDKEFKYYLLNNTEDIQIDDGETKDVIPEFYFTATKGTVVVFHAEILLDVETTVSDSNYYDGIGIFTYYYNRNLLTDH